MTDCILVWYHAPTDVHWHIRMDCFALDKVKGIYVLLMELKVDEQIKIGKLGKIVFKKGFYAYVGSAMNGLENRIQRHLKRKKKLHWHIDWFLRSAKIKDVMYLESSNKMECKVAQVLAKRFESIKGFGSSDCKCTSHMFFSTNLQLLKQLVVGDLRLHILGNLKVFATK